MDNIVKSCPGSEEVNHNSPICSPLDHVNDEDCHPLRHLLTCRKQSFQVATMIDYEISLCEEGVYKKAAEHDYVQKSSLQDTSGSLLGAYVSNDEGCGCSIHK